MTEYYASETCAENCAVLPKVSWQGLCRQLADQGLFCWHETPPPMTQLIISCIILPGHANVKEIRTDYWTVLFVAFQSVGGSRNFVGAVEVCFFPVRADLAAGLVRLARVEFSQQRMS